MFGDHGGQTGMAQAFLHDRQHLLAGLDEYDPIRLQSGAGKAGGEQIGLAQHPKNGAIEPGQNSGREQGGSGGMFRIGSSRSGFVQGAETDTAGRQNVIYRFKAQGKRLFRRSPKMDAFDPGDPLPQQSDR